MKKVTQIRMIKNTSNNSIAWTNTTGSGNLLPGPTYSIGIQALPGTKFVLDGNTILIGFTGIFELTTYNDNYITELLLPNVGANKHIIIDVVYEE